MVLVKLTKPELRFLEETLDAAREEFTVLVQQEDWYVTDMDERCLAAFNILKFAEKEEKENATEVE